MSLSFSGTFTLKDSQTGTELDVEVESIGGFLILRPDGYEPCVTLDFFDKKLRLLVDTPDSEDPNIVDLENMKNDAR